MNDCGNCRFGTRRSTDEPCTSCAYDSQSRTFSHWESEGTRTLPQAGPVPANATQVGGDHYKRHAIQPIDFIRANGLGFCAGNVVKYVTRYPYKNGVEDLKKARQYIDFLIEEEEKKNGSR